MQDINAPSIAIWLGDWLIYLLLYYTSILIFLFKDGGHPPYALSAVLLLLSTKVIVGQVIYFFTDHKMWAQFLRCFWSTGYPLAFTPLYSLLQLVFALTVWIIQMLHLVGWSCADNDEVFLAFYVASIVYAFSSMSVFVQLNKQTGHTLIIMDRMMQEAAQFLLLGFVMFMPFPISFHILHSPPSCTPDGNDNDDDAHHMTTVSGGGGGVYDNSTADVTVYDDSGFTSASIWNVDDVTLPADVALNGSLLAPSSQAMFSTFSKSCYETLLLAEGIMYPNPIHFDDAISPSLARFYYIFLLFMIGIVLFNLLIALMTDRVSFLNQHKDTIQGLQRVSMAKLLKFNSKFGTRIFNKIAWFRNYTAKINDRYFTTNEDKTRVFLHVVEKITHLQTPGGNN